MALILVIDDSSITRKAVCRTVREGGHESLQASDGREGFEMAISSKPDCIVLDLIKPLITDNLNNVIKRVLAPSKENANGHDTRSD
jgi:CheY-like chemotaxis protein